MTDLSVIEKKIDPQVHDANTLAVQSQDDMIMANAMLQGIKAIKKEINESCDPIIKAAHDTHKKAVAQKKVFMEPLDRAEGVIKGKIGGYLDYLDAERRKEEARLREKAEKQQAKEMEKANKKVEALIEKAGGVEDQIKAIEAELEDPELTNTEIELLTAKRDSLVLDRDRTNRVIQETVDRVEAKASVPTPIPAREAPKVKGLSSAVKIVPSVVNSMALVRAVADGRAPLGVIKAWDMSVISKLVNAGMNVPGVATQTVRNISVR
jgi:hypothetical protein